MSILDDKLAALGARLTRVPRRPERRSSNLSRTC
jgi:hypothetical protein